MAVGLKESEHPRSDIGSFLSDLMLLIRSGSNGREREEGVAHLGLGFWQIFNEVVALEWMVARSLWFPRMAEMWTVLGRSR
jgi:hypothetical protein